SVPVKSNESTIYSLNATIAPAQLLNLMTEQKLPSGWIGAIIDSNGCIVGRTTNMQKFVGKKVTPALWQQINSSNEGGFVTQTLDNIPAFTVYSRSAATKWTVALAMPLAQITEGLRHTLILLIIATFCALILGLALAWFIGGRVADSIIALISPATALGSNKPFTVPHLYFTEANKLRQALLNASVTLRQAQYDAYHDGLTGLPNREFFHTVLNQQLSLCQRDKTALAVLYIDLDGFKQVNDSYGHARGDELLRTVSMRIKNAIRASDIAARLGGDEFAIALINSNLENATKFAHKLIEIISEPYLFGTNKVMISASIGVAEYPTSATDTDTLLKNADHAMYNAKGLGKRQVCVAAKWTSKSG
ncbi:diguanylate cyclase, partial [Glaciimonas sp. CA11.2]